MSTYFTTDDTEIEMHADALGLKLAPKFIGLSPRRTAPDDQASNQWLLTFRVTSSPKLRRRIVMRQPPMLHLG
jgi:hypothetical protein